MKTTYIIILSLLDLSFCRENPDTAPVWPLIFEQNFNETLNESMKFTETNGRIYYDYPNNLYRLDRESGKYDAFCTTNDTDVPCSQYVRDGNRYVYLPETDECCFCCTAAQGCGLLRPNWVDGAKFTGFQTDREGNEVEVWSKDGLNANNIFARIDSRLISRIEQLPNHYADYDLNSLIMHIEDPDVFNLPSKCNLTNKCPKTSFCALLNPNIQSIKFLEQ